MNKEAIILICNYFKDDNYCIITFFDYRGRTGFVSILSLKVGLSVMCSEKVQEKYRCRCTFIMYMY